MVLWIIGIVAVSAICGKIISRGFEKREVFFNDLENFCLFLKSEITFKQSKIGDIYEQFYKTYNPASVEMIKRIEQLSTDRQKNISLLEKIYFLKKEEKQIIYDFAITIGKTDEDNQIANIKNFVEYVKRWQQEASLKRKQNTPLCYKVCLAIGAVICVLIV